jgi:single-stranded DNA-binding protein
MYGFKKRDMGRFITPQEREEKRMQQSKQRGLNEFWFSGELVDAIDKSSSGKRWALVRVKTLDEPTAQSKARDSYTDTVEMLAFGDAVTSLSQLKTGQAVIVKGKLGPNKFMMKDGTEGFKTSLFISNIYGIGVMHAGISRPATTAVKEDSVEIPF